MVFETRNIEGKRLKVIFSDNGGCKTYTATYNQNNQTFFVNIFQL